MTAISCKKCLYEGNPAGAHYCASCGDPLDDCQWCIVSADEIGRMKNQINSLRDTLSNEFLRDVKRRYPDSRWTLFKLRFGRWADSHNAWCVLLFLAWSCLMFGILYFLFQYYHLDGWIGVVTICGESFIVVVVPALVFGRSGDYYQDYNRTIDFLKMRSYNAGMSAVGYLRSLLPSEK